MENNTVWLYWENRYSDRMPAYLDMCLQSAQRHRGAAEVVVLNPETLGDYLDLGSLPKRYATLSPNHKTDYLRMRLLRDYGGMYLDIDAIIFRSLSEHVLSRLETAELVSPGDSLFQSFFASRQGGAFVSAAVEALEERLATDDYLGYQALGSELVYPIAAHYPHAQVSMKVWIYGWREWEKYLQPGEVSYQGRLACMLYNKYMFEPLKDLTNDEILSRDWLVGKLLGHALAT